MKLSKLAITDGLSVLARQKIGQLPNQLIRHWNNVRDTTLGKDAFYLTTTQALNAAAGTTGYFVPTGIPTTIKVGDTFDIRGFLYGLDLPENWSADWFEEVTPNKPAGDITTANTFRSQGCTVTADVAGWRSIRAVLYDGDTGTDNALGIEVTVDFEIIA